MTWRFTLLQVLVVLLLSACGTTQPVSARSGIEGQVFIGPMCPGPVVQAATPCPDQPFQATITILDINGEQVTRFQTDAEGRFRVPLDPGTYTLVPESSGGIPWALQQTVTVTSEQFTQVMITYSSGIQ